MQTRRQGERAEADWETGRQGDTMNTAARSSRSNRSTATLRSKRLSDTNVSGVPDVSIVPALRPATTAAVPKVPVVSDVPSVRVVLGTKEAEGNFHVSGILETSKWRDSACRPYLTINSHCSFCRRAAHDWHPVQGLSNLQQRPSNRG